MIDVTGTDMAAALSPLVPSERRDEGGPAFAMLLAQASGTPEGARVPHPIPEPVADAAPLPVSQPQETQAQAVPVRRARVDHAIRFDARGMIAMAAGTDSVATTLPVVAASMVPDRVSVSPTQAMTLADGTPPVGRISAAAPAAASALPGGHVEAVRPAPMPVVATTRATGTATPASSPRPDEPEVATAPVARRHTRFATMAPGAPKVAVIALADGLAVSAAVGALPESERHRMRDAIAATLSRHGLRPRAVTLLAMPAPIHSTER